MVPGMKERWKRDILFSGTVNVFDVRSVLTVSTCRGRGRVYLI